MRHKSLVTLQRGSYLALVLVLMLNVAAIAHAIDDAPHHHLHHQCELFSAIQFGLAHTPVTLPQVKQKFETSQPLAIQKVKRLYFAYLARSPPSIVS
ncbi:DUF2607 family protein [Vibrio sp. 99-70-13A1]|uniref:DUF2607 family protein n=1 Tax=Vibrio sp. 99-70-13A1 TaxID=2607601 RepID=UPI001493C5DB|nr:DUF2607 family protein [Vibrio sp. 99-70-13A1]NOH97080.1 DUF2607 family protein [Vibrio sp. 99-70-13A1]